LLAGNTSDKTTLAAFLAKIKAQYGAAEQIWIMDRGIPTEDSLALMRGSTPPVHDLVGTSKGRLTQLEKALLSQPWGGARPRRCQAPVAGRGSLYPGPQPWPLG